MRKGQSTKSNNIEPHQYIFALQISVHVLFAFSEDTAFGYPGSHISCRIWNPLQPIHYSAQKGHSVLGLISLLFPPFDTPSPDIRKGDKVAGVLQSVDWLPCRSFVARDGWMSKWLRDTNLGGDFVVVALRLSVEVTNINIDFWNLPDSSNLSHS